MKMIQDLLSECGYSEQQTFLFAYQGASYKWEHSVTPFVSKKGACEGYLLVSVEGRELPNLLNSEFLSEITRELGHQEFYSTDLDRNITLLLLCKRADDEQIDHDAKVRIEDDPYYFKKYIFTYTEQEEAAALAYAGEQEGILADIVTNYLMDTERFSRYKVLSAEDRTKEKEKKSDGENKAGKEEKTGIGEREREYLAYQFFVELATKVTAMPIHPRSNLPIRSVEDYWQEELREEPVADLDALKDILEMDSDDLDDVLEKWNGLNRIGGG